MRSFLDCRSLTEMAFTLVVLSVLSVIPIGTLTGILAVVLSLTLGGIFGVPQWDGWPLVCFLISIVVWGAAIVAVWLRFVRVGRSWSRPNLETNEFFLFQVVAGGFVLMLSLLFPWPETIATTSLIRGFFSFISVLMNLCYVSLAIAIKAKLPPKIYFALVADILIATLPFWGK